MNNKTTSSTVLLRRVSAEEEKMFRESSELLADEEKWDEERESRSSWEEVQLGTEEEPNILVGPPAPESGLKGSLSTAVDKIMRLVELSPPRRKEGSTFAELYLEEQKHAEECLKAKLAAEITAESLRAELKELRRQPQHNTTAASAEEQFAKHQVVVLRQRLEKSILERDQARAENQYLKMQLKEITLQLKNQAQKQHF